MNDKGTTKDEFVVRLASSQDDFDFAKRMVREEQWASAGTHTLDHVGPVVKPGFFIGHLNGQRIGVVCATKYGEDGDLNCFCYVGCYVVDKKFRGQGYGKKIWKEMWETLPKDCNISLDGVAESIQFYEKMGLRQEWQCKEYILTCSNVMHSFREVTEKALSERKGGLEIKSLSDIDFEKLLEYDTLVFGVSRRGFLEKWITISEKLGWAALNEKSDIIGYVVMRCAVLEKHQVVGPLFCDNAQIARVLLYTAAKSAVEERSSEKLVMWTNVGDNDGQASMSFVERELQETMVVLESARMYSKGVPPSTCHEKIMAITHPGFG